MSFEEINHLVTGLLDAWNAHDIERAAAFFASEYEGLDVAQAKPLHGPDGERRRVAYYLAAFPDLHFTREDLVVQGSRVVLTWKGRGTHQGRLMNIPATGRTIEVWGVSLLTVEQNKIQKGLYIWDVAGLLRSLGLLPELR